MLTFYFSVSALLLNAAFFIALWHLDINHALDRLGQEQTRGFFRITPEKGFRYSYYVLILVWLVYNAFSLYVFVNHL